VLAASSDPLTEDELRSVVGPRKTGRRLALVAAIGLLAGGLCAWRYMPAEPIAALATTTIYAPKAPAMAAAAPPPAPPPAALPAPPETSPAPEGNALADAIAKPPLASIKAAAKAKTTTWKKQRVKLRGNGKTVTVKKHV
jgi:hypothetical protein